MKDAINAEDIANFPDANLAESLQRLPGVALDRDNGEGRGITVRGLGSDFTRVRLNGLETLSTAAASDSGTSPNRGRGFDFNVFASDLFSSLEVTKTASASADEGALGATVDLVTGKPLDYKGTKLALSTEDAYYENGGTHNPRIAGLVATQFFDDTIGVSLSGAYSERTSEVDRYKRQAGQSDYEYRGATFAGSCRHRVPASPLPRARLCRHHRQRTVSESRGDRRADRIGPRRLCVAVPGCAVQHSGPLQRFAGAHSRADEHRAAGPRAGAPRPHRRNPVEAEREHQDRPRHGVFEVRSEERRQPDPVRRPESQQHQREFNTARATTPPRPAAARIRPAPRRPRCRSACDGLRRHGGDAGRRVRRPRHDELQHQSEQSRSVRLLQQSGLARVWRRRGVAARTACISATRSSVALASKSSTRTCRKPAMPTISRYATSTGARRRTPRTSPRSSSRHRSKCSRKSPTR